MNSTGCSRSSRPIISASTASSVSAISTCTSRSNSTTRFIRSTSGALTFLGQPVDTSSTMFDFDRFETTNNFYGGQLGTQLEWNWGRWSVDLDHEISIGHDAGKIHYQRRHDGLSGKRAGNVGDRRYPRHDGQHRRILPESVRRRAGTRSECRFCHHATIQLSGWATRSSTGATCCGPATRSIRPSAPISFRPTLSYGKRVPISRNIKRTRRVIGLRASMSGWTSISETSRRLCPIWRIG